jgi:hypothetical protein
MGNNIIGRTFAVEVLAAPPAGPSSTPRTRDAKLSEQTVSDALSTVGLTFTNMATLDPHSIES